MKKLVGWPIATFCTIFVDQSVKLCLTISGQKLNLNKGIGFGVFGGSEIAGVILNFVGILGAGYLLINLIRSKQEKNKSIYLILLGIILGAGISNFIDRIFRGGVVDYIRLWSLPEFNIADLLITVSVVILLILFLSDSINERKEKRI